MNDFRECARRAVRTFFQAALACTAVDIAGLAETGGFTKSALAALLTAAVAAGLAAVMNLPPRGGVNCGSENDETKEENEDEQAV